MRYAIRLECKANNNSAAEQYLPKGTSEAEAQRIVASIPKRGHGCTMCGSVHYVAILVSKDDTQSIRI